MREIVTDVVDELVLLVVDDDQFVCPLVLPLLLLASLLFLGDVVHVFLDPFPQLLLGQVFVLGDFFLQVPLHLLLLLYSRHVVHRFLLQQHLLQGLVQLVDVLYGHRLAQLQLVLAELLLLLLHVLLPHLLNRRHVVLQLLVLPKYLGDSRPLLSFLLLGRLELDEFLLRHLLVELPQLLVRRVLDLELDSFRSGQEHVVHVEAAAVDGQLRLHLAELDNVEEGFFQLLVHEMVVDGALRAVLVLLFLGVGLLLLLLLLLSLLFLLILLSLLPVLLFWLFLFVRCSLSVLPLISSFLGGVLLPLLFFLIRLWFLLPLRLLLHWLLLNDLLFLLFVFLLLVTTFLLRLLLFPLPIVIFLI